MRAKRTTEEQFYDVFADMSIEEQEVALKLLSYEHHQAKRRLKKAAEWGKKFEAMAQVSGSAGGTTGGTTANYHDLEFAEVEETDGT